MGIRLRVMAVRVHVASEMTQHSRLLHFLVCINELADQEGKRSSQSVYPVLH